MPGTIADWERVRAEETVREGDILVTDHGSIWTVRPLSERAKEWVSENVSHDSQHFGHAVVVEPRYIMALVDGLLDAGFVLR